MVKKLIFSCLFVWFQAGAQDTVKTNIIIDSLGNEVYLLLDGNQQPKNYYSPVYTPVCVDGSCYPINIELHWDLAGDYLKYTLPQNEILTKIEHLSFTDFDYGLLHRMIAKSPSALANFSIYDLTLPDENKVDGITGATRPELSGSFVPDALYTTFTLWHMVRRPKRQLLNFTKQNYFVEEWASFIMNNSVLECRKVFVNHLVEGYVESEKAVALFSLLHQYGTSFPLDLMAEIAMNETNKREFIKLYQKTEHNTIKAAILERWKHHGVDESELLALMTEIGHCSACFNAELQIIDEFKHWPEIAYNMYYAKLQSQPNMMRREKMKKVLETRVELYPRKFRKVIKKNSNT